MNELQIFDRDTIAQIKKIDVRLKGSYLGVFYAVEWGGKIKIGQSKQPYARMMALKRTAEKYGEVSLGRVCISALHTNYRENESKLHLYFADKRDQGTEIFNISLDNFISSVPSAGIVYKDESEKMCAHADAFFCGMKNFVLTGRFEA